jgi:hypothetical protein
MTLIFVFLGGFAWGALLMLFLCGAAVGGKS